MKVLLSIPVLTVLACAPEKATLPEYRNPTIEPAMAQVQAPGDRQTPLTVFVRLRSGTPANHRAELRANGASFVSRFHGSLPMAVDVTEQGYQRLRHLPWLEILGVDSSAADVPQSAGSLDFMSALRATDPQEVPLTVLLVGAPTAHANGFRGAGVKVGVLDTGVKCSHYDFDGAVVGSYDFDSDQAVCVNGFHGTGVGGIIGARDNSIDALGVAPEADLYNLRICTPGCSHGRLYDGIGYAVTNGLDVLNYSAGDCGGGSLSIQLKAMLDLYDAVGGIFVASGGNGSAASPDPCSATDPVSTVAAADHTIAVAAHNVSGTYILGYQYGPEIDFSAPTGGLTLSHNGGTYASFGGTSGAAPHVAGAAAVLLSAGFSPSKVYARLKDTAINPSGGAHTYVYGWGKIDVGLAAALKPRVDSVRWCTTSAITTAGSCTLQAYSSNGAGTTAYLFEITRSDQSGTTVLGWGGSAQSYTVQPGNYSISVKVTPRDNAYGRLGFYQIQDIPVCTGESLWSGGEGTNAEGGCGGGGGGGDEYDE